MEVQYLRALHIIFIVSWFAGLFFLGRMYVYHIEALGKDENEKNVLTPLLESAEKRVMYIITLPSMLITLAVGTRLAMLTGAYREGWFHFKLLFILLFLGYNHFMGKIRKKLLKNTCTLSSTKLRLLNEVPFLFLIAIVFTVFLRSFFSGLWAAAVLVGIFMLLSLIGYMIKKKKKA